MATRSAKIDQKADLIWAIADKLTGVYKPHEYGDVILPLTVIRRFDCILSDTKDAVLQKYEEVKNLPMKDVLLRKVAEKDFYNTSKYTFERLMDDPDHIEENFRDYLNGFSANVQDILEKFKFDGHITTMANKGSAAVNSVVKDRASFVEYIAFVLGDDYVASMLEGKQMGESGFFANSSDAMPALYEKMLKTSVEEPERIKDIGYVLKMVTDKDIIPDEFRELYETFCNTLKIRR